MKFLLITIILVAYGCAPGTDPAPDVELIMETVDERIERQKHLYLAACRRMAVERAAKAVDSSLLLESYLYHFDPYDFPGKPGRPSFRSVDFPMETTGIKQLFDSLYLDSLYRDSLFRESVKRTHYDR